MTAPDWLTQRGCGLKLGSDGRTWYVLLDNAPHYSLAPVPVDNQVGCVIRQTESGRRIDSNGTYPTPDDAIRGGLEDLRKALGWA
jgi:hypothetical protein